MWIKIGILYKLIKLKEISQSMWSIFVISDKRENITLTSASFLAPPFKTAILCYYGNIILQYPRITYKEQELFLFNFQMCYNKILQYLRKI